MRDGLFSLILLSYNSSSRICEIYDRLRTRMEHENIPFELIIIDDDSKDDSFELAKEIAAHASNVRAYQLSRNYTSVYSSFAGLSVCEGDCATLIPDDWQIPLDLVVGMYREWQFGHQVVFPYRISRNDGILSDTMSRMYYGVMNVFSKVKFPALGIDDFCIDREIIDLINLRIHPINTSPITEILRLGFNPKYIPYSRPENIYCKSRWSFRKKYRVFLDTFLSNSDFPIKFISIIGLFSFLMSLSLIVIIVALKISGYETIAGISIPGWTTTLVIVSFFCGTILLSLGIIAEYIYRIYDEVKCRPGFIIKR